MTNKLSSPDGIQLESLIEKVIWLPVFSLKDKENRHSITLNLEALATELGGSEVKKIVIQKIPKENNKLKIGLVIYDPNVLLEEPEHAKQEQPEARGPGSM